MSLHCLCVSLTARETVSPRASGWDYLDPGLRPNWLGNVLCYHQENPGNAQTYANIICQICTSQGEFHKDLSTFICPK